MMLQPIGIRILKRYGLTTGRVEDHQSVSRLVQTAPEHGEKRTLEGHGLTRVFPEPSGMAVWCEHLVADVENQSRSLITKTMTNLFLLCGFASHAINNDIKK